MRFEDLRGRVGHDDPGNFRYHLERLREDLVERTDEGYQLSNVGHELTATLLSDQFDPTAELELADEEVDCLVCGAPATVSYADGLLRVDCEAEHSFRANVGPEVVQDRSVETALDLVLLQSRFDSRLAAGGLCPICDGRTDPELTRREAEGIAAVFEATCRRCGAYLQWTAGWCVLDHPAVVSLCYDHGLDVRRDARTVLAEHVEPAAVRAEDPLRVDVRICIEDDTVTLQLDECGRVVDVSESRMG